MEYAAQPLGFNIRYRKMTSSVWTGFFIMGNGKRKVPLCVKSQHKFGSSQIFTYLCDARTPKPLYNAQIGGRFIFIPQ